MPTKKTATKPAPKTARAPKAASAPKAAGAAKAASASKAAITPKAAAPKAPARARVQVDADVPVNDPDAIESPRYARAQSRAASDTRAFVEGHVTTDPLAEELAENAVRAMTSGDDEPADPEGEDEAQSGGPFVITDNSVEMADDDESPNGRDAERAAFPTTHDAGDASVIGRDGGAPARAGDDADTDRVGEVDAEDDAAAEEEEEEEEEE